ncbi:hypothetical protein SDC9_67945 [bioreactor metagenome]|uniref:Uncharacterized protein n=1 Tax=bioreactor metagenome TaxID=1076179 RepID=A0A644Y0R9_9ZZZZ
MLGGPPQQATPARTHIQKTLAGLQVQLAADVVELGLLRLRQTERWIAVIRT